MTHDPATDTGIFDRNKCTGLFGGTFDPVHNGHLGIAKQLISSNTVEQVIFIPVARPPHKQGQTITLSRHRLAMLELAIQAQHGLYLSNFELSQSEISYTIKTAAYFSREMNADFYLIIGADSLITLHTWHQFQELIGKYQFLIYRRSDTKLPDKFDLSSRLGTAAAEKLLRSIVSGPLYDVSSSCIRRRITNGEPIGELIPKPVHDYIIRHRLYYC